MIYSSYYTFLLGCFAIAIYVMTADKNVVDYFLLKMATVRISLSRFVFMIKLYPRLRYETFLLKRGSRKIPKKYMEMAKNLTEEINKNG
jgi:hypothetical protein